MESILMVDYINHNRDLHLIVGYLRKWEPGETKEVYIFDRNFEEYIWNNKESCKEYSPENLFENSKAWITYTGGTKWTIEYSYGETLEQPIEISLQDLNLNTNWTWSPFCDGHILLDTNYKNGEIIKLPKNKQQIIYFEDLNDWCSCGLERPDNFS